jgi:hypothetical protein
VVLSPLGLGAVAYESQFESVRTFFTGSGQPAVRLLGCRARFASDGSTVIQSLVPATIAVSPIEAFDSALQLHPDRIGLLPNAASTGLTLVNSVLRSEEVPTLVATPAVPGEVATMRMTSHQPRLGAVLLGGMAGNPFWFDLGNIWIDTIGPTQIAAMGIADPAGMVFQTVVSTSPALRGQVFCLQGVVWEANGWPVLSGPGLWPIL